jgi:ribosome-binding factor A
MGSKRLEKIESQLIREISDILLRKISDPRLGWVTITRVHITPDLSLARIYITTLEGGEKRAAALEALHNAEGYIRHELGSRLELRITPQVHFQMDEQQEKVERVYQILEDLKHEKGQDHG